MTANSSQPPLRAVQPGESAPVKPKPKTLREAARSDDAMDLLVMMRDRIIDAIADTRCPPRDLAALTRRVQEIVKEIAALTAQRQQAADNGAGQQVSNTYDPEAI